MSIWLQVVLFLLFMWVTLPLYRKLGNKPKCESWIEQRLYNALTRKGYMVSTQVRCGPYRIDLCIGSVAIECDGKAYHSLPHQKKYDRKRSAYLYRHGYRSVLRFTGKDINFDIEKCVGAIEKKLFKVV